MRLHCYLMTVLNLYSCFNSLGHESLNVICMKSRVFVLDLLLDSDLNYFHEFQGGKSTLENCQVLQVRGFHTYSILNICLSFFPFFPNMHLLSTFYATC